MHSVRIVYNLLFAFSICAFPLGPSKKPTVPKTSTPYCYFAGSKASVERQLSFATSSAFTQRFKLTY